MELIGARPGSLPLANGGFEATAPESANRDGAPIHGWPECSGPTRVTTDLPRTGQYALRMGGEAVARDCTAEPVPVAAGQEYSLSVWARGYSGNAATAGGWIGITWLDADMQPLATAESEPIVVAKNFHWQRRETTITAPDGAAHVRLSLAVSASTPAGSYVFYDDLRIAPLGDDPV